MKNRKNIIALIAMAVLLTVGLGVGSGSADQLLTGRNRSTPVPTAASTPVVAAPVATVAVSRLPKDALVEIDCVARVPDHGKD